MKREVSADAIQLPGARDCGVTDVFVTGSAALQGGKFSEFIRDTIIDRRLGYPLKSTTVTNAASTEAGLEGDDTGATVEVHLRQKGGDSASNSVNSVTLIATAERIEEADVDLEGVIQESHCPGFGGLGGGGEYD